MFKVLIFSFLSTCLLFSGSIVKVKTTGENHELIVDGKKFYVHGLTIGNVTLENGDQVFKDIKEIGANAVRTWGTDDKTIVLLDMAEKHGIKVMMGLWLRHGRDGAEGEDNFNWETNEKGKQDHWDQITAKVEKYKDHPALLMWGVGNEVYLNVGPENEKIAYSRFLGKLTTHLKSIDPDHPIASVGAWTIPWKYWIDYCPDIDIYGVNTYGPGAGVIPGEVEKFKLNKPYLICEYGVQGEWETPKDKYDIAIEPDDKRKYRAIDPGFADRIEQHKGKNIGGYVFHLTGAFDFTSVWLALKMNEYFRPQYWATRKAFSGQAVPNKHPAVAPLQIEKRIVKRGKMILVNLKFGDKESKKEDLKIEFYYNFRKGIAAERGRLYKMDHKTEDINNYLVSVPEKKGIYKIFAFVSDPEKNLSIASTSFKVK